MRSLFTTLTLITLLTASTTAFAEKPKLDAYDIFGLEYASQPQISPNGEQIVYVRQQMNKMSDRNIGHLWLMDIDGSRHQPLTTGATSASNPRWSPDGSRILYIGRKDSGSQLYVLWLDSGRTAQLTQGPYAPSNPSWSPDGSRIAFNQFVPSEAPRLVKPMKMPEGANWAPTPTVIDRPVFRVDGQGFLPHGQTQRFIISTEGGALRQITEGPYPQNGPAIWTADGEQLIFTSNQREDWELEGNDTELFRLTLTTGQLEALTDRYGPDNSPALSPDGETLAWLGFDDALMSYTNSELYVMSLEDGEPQLLTGDLDRDIDAFEWADNGRSIYISYADYGIGVIERIRLNGDRTRIAEHLGGTTLGRPYASGDFDVGPDGVVFTQTTPQQPGDLFLSNGNRETRLTRLNSQMLQNHQLARVEEFRYPSSHDGLEIQGWFAYPPDYQEGKAYPLILEIHGGPFADYGPRFSMEVQLMAAAGYVVAYINPRGSTSYGADFANKIHHAYPGNDYYDLISGVDMLIERGLVDPDRLYVTGGSGGGVLTAWIIGKTDRFKAAAVVKPVINWTSFVLTGDFTPFFHKYWFPALPWEAPEHYHARSPLALAGNVTTPTMVMTGEADWRTPMWESEQYYQALKLQGIDSVLVRIPEAPHSIAARPSQMATKIAHILAWFEKYP